MEFERSITRLGKIFKDKNWFAKDHEEFAFNNFCYLLGILEPHERELLLELTEHYIWISAAEYIENISIALNSVPKEDLEHLHKIYLFPIVKPKDIDQTKSGNSLIYEVSGISFKLSKYTGIKFNTLNTFQELEDPFELKDNECLFLIDDYIGEGGTLTDCISEILKNKKITLGKVKVISISCQKNTLAKFIDQGIDIYCSHTLQKGISDYSNPEDIENKKELMRTIESSIPGADRFSLGWKESEGIITLKRTPNNTFPIFWKNLRRQGKYFQAPFLRG
nr:hypothetical protein [uncultured Pedobacter sp.]